MSESEEEVDKGEGSPFEEVKPVEVDLQERLRLNDLKNVTIHISADLGQTSMTVRDVLQLKEGSVIALNKLAGELTDIYGNGMLLGRGEVVVIGDELHVRVSEIEGVEDAQGLYHGDSSQE